MHTVKTLAGLQKWVPDATDGDLPAVIYQDKTPDGRLSIMVINADGCKIADR